MFRKYSVISSVSIAIALLVIGCNDNKASQCRRLIQVVNEGNALIDKNKGQQVVTSVQLSKDLEVITTSIKELNLSDPKLKEFQDGFAQVFDKLSQAIAKAAQALGSAKSAEASASGREKLQKARKDIDTALTNAAKSAGKESDTLVKQINKYCSEP